MCFLFFLSFFLSLSLLSLCLSLSLSVSLSSVSVPGISLFRVPLLASATPPAAERRGGV